MKRLATQLLITALVGLSMVMGARALQCRFTQTADTCLERPAAIQAQAEDTHPHSMGRHLLDFYP